MRGNSGRSSSTRSPALRRRSNQPGNHRSNERGNEPSNAPSSEHGNHRPSEHGNAPSSEYGNHRKPRRSPPRLAALARSLPSAGLALLAAASLPLAACAPSVETPAEAGYRRDLRDAERLAAQLRHLPAVREAHVTLTRPVVDPLRQPAAPSADPPGAAAILLSLDGALAGAAETDALARDARALALAIAPELPPSAVAVVARAKEPPPVLARVGPFEVARRSRAPLLAALLGLLAACAGLGITLALRERGRRLAG